MVVTGFSSICMLFDRVADQRSYNLTAECFQLLLGTPAKRVRVSSGVDENRFPIKALVSPRQMQLVPC
ncbi:hypothetical protein CSW57_04355 [Williamsia muralis]|uniref:Uncharacterized protein n=1 Tax=Williamsia marianensis TaxID=85044 RepID=A0A2G3PRM5_WILMA|nr:hypothetical protein CSW57_04355 [Williamsia marianensis]